MGKMEQLDVPQIELAVLKPTNVLIYEYGARLDKDSVALVQDQLFKAHNLYNMIVACMRDTMNDLAQLQLEAAGDHAKELAGRIEVLDQAFTDAKAKDYRDALTVIATERRELRRELWGLLKATRSATKEQSKPLFARIGRNSTCKTYQLRSEAVANGLGWATANATLESALNAWKKTIKRGQAPRFSRATDKTQRTLTLQFTRAGGIPAEDLLSSRSAEAQIQAPKRAAPRQYGTFSLRMGAAASAVYANGTWQYHRAIPEGASIGLVRLVVRRHADKNHYAIQMMVKLPEPVVESKPEKCKPLAAIHMGWSSDDAGGRRIAGIATGADPGLGRILQLPPDIEEDLHRADDLQSARDEGRNQMMAVVKRQTPSDYPEAVEELLKALKRLPAEHVPPRRLYVLTRLLAEAGLETVELHRALIEWRKQDRKVWQAREGIADRARNRRRDFYRATARDLVNGFSAIAYEPLDLAAAALKLDEENGEKTEFTKAARAGRFVAALYEFEQAIVWACTKTRTPLIHVSGGTASICPYCQAKAASTKEDWQLIECASCGASVDRKLAGAANAWQMVEPNLEGLRAEFHSSLEAQWLTIQEEKRERMDKMAAGRTKGRPDRSTMSAAT